MLGSAGWMRPYRDGQRAWDRVRRGGTPQTAATHPALPPRTSAPNTPLNLSGATSSHPVALASACAPEQKLKHEK